MKRTILVVSILIAGLLLGWNLKAQTPGPWQVGVTGLHTACTTTAGATSYCFASDGLWVSLNGAAYVQVGTPTGTLVTSVNGKTGTVVLAIQ